MPKAIKQVTLTGGSADDIEASFYEALQSGDLDKLMACWADEDSIVCVHPGGPRLIGVAAIRAAFEVMFSNSPIPVWPQSLRKIESLTSMVHSVLERIDVLTDDGPRQAYVIATNVYHRTPQGWRMVAHHATPGALHEGNSPQDASQVLH